VFERVSINVFVCLCVHSVTWTMVRAQSIRSQQPQGARKVSLRDVHCNLSRHKHGNGDLTTSASTAATAAIICECRYAVN